MPTRRPDWFVEHGSQTAYQSSQLEMFMAQTQETWHLVNPTSLILCKQLNELQTFRNIKIAQLKQHVCPSPWHPFTHTLSKQDQLKVGKLEVSDESDSSTYHPQLMSTNTVHCAGHSGNLSRIGYKDFCEKRNVLLNISKDIYSLGFARKHLKIPNRDNVNICQHYRKVSGVRAGSRVPCR